MTIALTILAVILTPYLVYVFYCIVQGFIRGWKSVPSLPPLTMEEWYEIVWEGKQPPRQLICGKKEYKKPNFKIV
jgi:hypothetical protein